MKKTLVFIFLTTISLGLYGQDFYAYYTKIEKGESWEMLDRTTEHPDIIVKVAGGQLIFWRGTSYLPIWETKDGSWTLEEVINRNGDGPEQRPDATNSFSSVRLISSDEDQIVIHWRYLPQFSEGNPKKNVDHLTIVDEYFTIEPDGSVYRTIKQGSANVNEWLNDKNTIEQRLLLIPEGIKLLESGLVTSEAESASVIWTATKQGPDNDPVIHLRFDEGEGNTTQEEIFESEVNIDGHKAYWKQGVSGTSLAFDGYASRIGIPSSSASISDDFSLEAWVALGAYPFNWAPIIQQSEYGESGFYFGVGPSGKITLRLKTGSWNILVTDYELPLHRWTHVVANFADGVASIYVDGQEVASKNFKGSFQPSKEDFIIGFNSHKQIPGDPVRPDCEECHTPVLFGFDGLIDEVKILDEALTSDEIYDSYLLLSPDQSVIKRPDLQPRELPRGPETGEFMAHYTSLKYYDTWDNLSRFGDHADIVVEFDDHPSKFIFWRGMNYVPQVVNAENQWYNNQFNESWDPGGSWGEPMSDKQSLRSHVRIIENTPARKVIHWRYAQVQIDGTQQNYDEEIGWGDWSDWYYFIYPDGVASKRMVHWSGDDPLNHEWQESIGVMGPGQTPESISDVYGETVYFDDLKITKSYNWSDEALDPDANVPLGLEDDWERRPLNIQVVNYRSKYKPFTIGDFKGGECYGDFDGKIAPYSNMVVYIHWPLGQLPTDGTRAFKPDRGSSNGYTHLMFKGSHRLGKNWAERVMLEGMSEKSTVQLRPLARSWLYAPRVKELVGADVGEYSMAERAYQFVLDDQSEVLSFSINASNKKPIENLCFVIKKWNSDQLADIAINNKKSVDSRQGVIIDTDGSKALVVYLALSSEEKTSFHLTRK